MADGQPKNFSKMFQERIKPLDGSFEPPRHREFNHQNAADFCNLVSAKLEAIALNNSSAEKEFGTNIVSTTTNKKRPAATIDNAFGFKLYVQYYDLKETFVLRIAMNDLRSIVERLPKKGNYRYFFKRIDNMCEEIESLQEEAPYFVNDQGVKQIFCQIFPGY